MTETTILACGCPESTVRDAGHGEGCRFEGMRADAYPWILRWADVCDHATLAQVRDIMTRARATNAPLDTFWEGADTETPASDDDGWLTVDQILSRETRRAIGLDETPETENIP
jgi:hypothetical protein